MGYKPQHGLGWTYRLTHLLSLELMNIETWWQQHHNQGGKVYQVPCNWNLVSPPKDFLEDLKLQLQKISFDEVLDFTNAEITDNDMPHRHALEEASKILYLKNVLADGEMNFVPQLVYDPNIGYRIHPGSGRSAAIWTAGITEFPTVYIYFNEPEFKIPINAHEIKDVQELTGSVVYQKYLPPDWEFYPVEPYTPKDSEWTWQTKQAWWFTRWSEGKQFLTYKRNWRDYAVEAWSELTV